MSVKSRPLLLPVFFILLTLYVSSKVSSGFPNGVVEPSTSILTEGSTLVINCTLTSYAASSLRSEALYFTSFYNSSVTKVNNTYYHIRNTSTMEMVIPDVKRDVGSTFKCFIADKNFTENNGDTHIGTASADIGEAPYPIENISVVSENLINMTVDWCPDVHQLDPVTSSLFWQIENSTSEYSGTCTAWKNMVHRCSCVFCSSPSSGVCLNKNQTFHSYVTYLINITSKNQFGATYAYIEVYTSPKIVKPGPVTKLKVESRSSRELNISWHIPDLVTFNLTYQISVSSKWGENFLVDVGTSMFWTLTNLTPHTNYTVAVRCKPTEEGYWSDDSVVYGVTLEDTPEVAPEVPIGFFRLSGCSDRCNVTIFWQLIDAKLQNGVIYEYQLSVRSANCSPCQDFLVPGSNQTSSVISLPSDVDSWVELVARTSVGESPPRHVFFPSYFDSLPNAFSQDLYAEYTMDKTGVFFKWNYSEDVDNYTFMYCHGIQNDQSHCQDSPEDIFLPGEQTNFTLNTADPYLVYSMSANYRNGTNGLTPQWLCIYEYSGLPEKPKLHSPTEMSDTSIKISWDALLCNSDNRVRVLQYILSYVSSSSDSGDSITLPGTVTEHVLTDLTPETPYKVTLYAVSRSGPGPNATEDIQTIVSTSVNVVIPVVVSVITVVLIIVVVIGIIFCVRKSHRWFYDIDIKAPDKHVASNILNDSSAGYEPYTIATMNSDGLNVFSSSSSSSSDPPILQHSHSEGKSSEATTEMSVVFDSIESIQTYTAVRNDAGLLGTKDPNYNQAMSVASCRLTDDQTNPNPPESSSPDLLIDSCGSCGYSRGKLNDDKFSSDDLCDSTFHKLHSSNSSVESLESCDDYMTTELQNCIAHEPIGPPATIQIDVIGFKN